VREVGERSLLALAVRFEGTRLIDNTLLEAPRLEAPRRDSARREVG
jgi:hypothetical protein